MNNVYESLAELVTAGAAIIAVVLSIAAFTIARRSERRHLFVQIHELLTSPESQAGRRLLHDAKDARELDRLRRKRDPREYDLINRAVSQFNTLALYARHGYLPLEMAKLQWADTIVRSWPRIEVYLLWRRKAHAAPALWEDLVWFAQECGAPVRADLRERRA
ncbi:hypothetical protein [Microbacterium sp. p3-SID336]|uniref:DUF4760 domain-containing protein n=1 Tax=Microbacterium sp. p3-SID336 TaxID=2916212 RepID=UPI0021A523B1|nr:hypothetical protein [Microbacterium sp. p3-SID336]MCT1476432.1 hypothetical protein [Microbacterium sp. p3-SID336]